MCFNLVKNLKRAGEFRPLFFFVMQDEELNIELTDNQKRFVEQYCIHFNGARAAREAGYSEDNARQMAHENLTKPYIKIEINKRLAELSMSAEEATKRLTDMARGSIASFLEVDENGRTLINLSKDDAKENLGLIKKIKQVKKELFDGSIIEISSEIELHDQKDAIIQILKLHGKFANKGDGEVKAKKYQLLDGTEDGESIENE